MKKFKIIAMATIAMFALGALVASSASAETTLEAKWLTGTGNNIAAGIELATKTTGEFEVEDSKAKTSVLCSVIFNGFVSAKGGDLTTKMLSLAGVEIEELKGTGLTCVNETGCSGTIEVWPEGLPWTSTLFLTEGVPILDLAVGSAGANKELGFSVLCTVLGINVVDTCLGSESRVEVLNDTNGEAETPEGAIAEPLGTCSVGGAGSGHIRTDALIPITLNNGELLLVSSE